MNPAHAYDPKREELVPLDGMEDRTDPLGGDAVGKAGTANLDREPLGRVLVRYKDKVMEVDVYPAPGIAMADGSLGLELHLFCPKCYDPQKPRMLRITSDRKQIHFEPQLVRDAESGQMIRRGVLSVEPFTCTWEVDGERRAFGLSLCGWKAGIDKNVARDA